MTTKVCPACRIEKDVDQFYSNKGRKGGKSSYCKPCSVKKAKAWQKANPEKVKESDAKRNRNRTKYLYGMSKEELDVILSEQDFGCAICGFPETVKNGDGSIKPLHVDHCHISSIFRGLLCNRCNSGLGYFDDDPDRLHAAIVYLEKARLTRLRGAGVKVKNRSKRK